ncbi:MAG: hypothetical protein QOD72_2889 [Acidimicrobiaceae bacterium]|nr:hypothetical protein [Acidimicrobiaceae bacterium]
MSSEEVLTQLLRAVKDGDQAGAPVDNEMLAAVLKLPLGSIASCLQEAKERSFIWGVRSGRQPGPWYEELEVTVQGKRFLSASSSAPAAPVEG